MKIAVSSSGPGLEHKIDPRFGRCICFVVIDTAVEEIGVLDNQAAMMSGGAGIQAAQMVVNSGARAVITGNLGPKAADTLAAAGVKTYTGASGTVGEALQQYQAGKLQESAGPTVKGDFGTKGMRGGGGPGRGRGRGREMGGGCGRSKGGGPGFGQDRSRGGR